MDQAKIVTCRMSLTLGLFENDHRVHPEIVHDDLNSVVDGVQIKFLISRLQRRLRDSRDSASDANAAERNHLFAHGPGAA